jgi:hypothetical protein
VKVFVVKFLKLPTSHSCPGSIPVESFEVVVDAVLAHQMIKPKVECRHLEMAIATSVTRRGIPRNLTKIITYTDMTIQWKSLVFRLNHFRGKMHFLLFFSKKTSLLK